MMNASLDESSIPSKYLEILVLSLSSSVLYHFESLTLEISFGTSLLKNIIRNCEDCINHSSSNLCWVGFTIISSVQSIAFTKSDFLKSQSMKQYTQEKSLQGSVL